MNKRNQRLAILWQFKVKRVRIKRRIKREIATVIYQRRRDAEVEDSIMFVCSGKGVREGGEQKL